MRKSRPIRNRLIIFNLETNLDSNVLAVAHDWVEAFSTEFSFIDVYSTHVGTFNLPKNVAVHELGGGSLVRRARNIFGLCRALSTIFTYRRNSVVLHHMSSRTLAILGLPLRLLLVPQGIWYSHSHLDSAFKFGRFFTNYVFTSIESSIPYSTSKIRYVGHGIKVHSQKGASVSDERRKGLVSLGRIARIKKLESILNSLAQSNIIDLPVTFIGPIHDVKYKEELAEFAEKNGIKLTFTGPLHHNEILAQLEKFEYLYTGTPGSVDKATLEGAISGCFIITTNSDAIKLSGMNAIWREININPNSNLYVQIKNLQELEGSTRSHLRRLLSAECAKNNDIQNTVKKIARVLSPELSPRMP